MPNLIEARWPFPLTQVSQDKSVPRPSVPKGLQAELVGVDGTLRGGVRPAQGVQLAYELDFFGNVYHDEDSIVTDFFPVTFRRGDDSASYGFVYRAIRGNPEGSTSSSSGSGSAGEPLADVFVDFWHPGDAAWCQGNLLMEGVSATAQMDVEVFGRLVYVFMAGRSPAMFYLDVDEEDLQDYVFGDFAGSSVSSSSVSSSSGSEGTLCSQELVVIGRVDQEPPLPGPGFKPTLLSPDTATPLGTLWTTGDPNRGGAGQVHLTELGPKASGLFQELGGVEEEGDVEFEEFGGVELKLVQAVTSDDNVSSLKIEAEDTIVVLVTTMGIPSDNRHLPPTRVLWQNMPGADFEWEEEFTEAPAAGFTAAGDLFGLPRGFQWGVSHWMGVLKPDPLNTVFEGAVRPDHPGRAAFVNVQVWVVRGSDGTIVAALDKNEYFTGKWTGATSQIQFPGGGDNEEMCLIGDSFYYSEGATRRDEDGNREKVPKIEWDYQEDQAPEPNTVDGTFLWSEGKLTVGMTVVGAAAFYDGPNTDRFVAPFALRTVPSSGLIAGGSSALILQKVQPEPPSSSSSSASSSSVSSSSESSVSESVGAECPEIVHNDSTLVTGQNFVEIAGVPVEEDDMVLAFAFANHETLDERRGFCQFGDKPMIFVRDVNGGQWDTTLRAYLLTNPTPGTHKCRYELPGETGYGAAGLQVLVLRGADLVLPLAFSDTAEHPDSVFAHIDVFGDTEKDRDTLKVCSTVVTDDVNQYTTANEELSDLSGFDYTHTLDALRSGQIIEEQMGHSQLGGGVLPAPTVRGLVAFGSDKNAGGNAKVWSPQLAQPFHGDYIFACVTQFRPDDIYTSEPIVKYGSGVMTPIPSSEVDFEGPGPNIHDGRMQWYFTGPVVAQPLDNRVNAEWSGTIPANMSISGWVVNNAKPNLTVSDIETATGVLTERSDTFEIDINPTMDNHLLLSSGHNHFDANVPGAPSTPGPGWSERHDNLDAGTSGRGRIAGQSKVNLHSGPQTAVWQFVEGEDPVTRYAFGSVIMIPSQGSEEEPPSSSASSSSSAPPSSSSSAAPSSSSSSSASGSVSGSELPSDSGEPVPEPNHVQIALALRCLGREGDIEQNWTLRLLSPEDTQQNVDVHAKLLWRGQFNDGRENPGDLVYDVWFGQVGQGEPRKVVTLNGSLETWKPGLLYKRGRLPWGETFQWWVVARFTNLPDFEGVESAHWEFTTKEGFDARKMEPGDYVFGFILFDSRTGRQSAFSTVAQARAEDFIGAEATAIEQYAAMEIVYDSTKFDQAYIYRSVKVQDAGGTFIAGWQQLDQIIELDVFRTINNGAGEVFPSTQPFRQSLYYYRLEDKQLVWQSAYNDLPDFDEQMPHGGAAIMYENTMLVSKVEGRVASTGEEVRVGDAFVGLGELRWSSLPQLSPELFPPANRYTPSIPTNEMISFVRVGGNVMGFSGDRMYHIRREAGALQVREMHEGFLGLVGHRGLASAGSQAFVLTSKGVKVVDAFAKLDHLHALDRVIKEDWRGSLSNVSMAYDPLVSVLFVHNSETDTTQCVWFDTAMLTEMHDMPFREVKQGSWPRTVTDYTDELTERAFFLQNYPGNTPPTAWKPRIYVLDYDREKVIAGATTGNGERRITTMDVEGNMIWNVTNYAEGAGVFVLSGHASTGWNRLEGAYVYVLDSDTVEPGTKGKISAYLDATAELTVVEEHKSRFAALAPGDRVVISPMHLRWVGANVGLSDPETGQPFGNEDYHRVKQVDEMVATFTDVSGPPLDDGGTDNRWRGLVYQENSPTPAEGVFPRDTRDEVHGSIQVVESQHPAAFGRVTDRDSRAGPIGVSLSVGLETFVPDLDYRLLSCLVRGKIQPTEYTTRAEQP
jgi:hypothetical protein